GREVMDGIHALDGVAETGAGLKFRRCGEVHTEDPSFPGLMEDGLLFLTLYRAESVHTTQVVDAVHGLTPPPSKDAIPDCIHYTSSIQPAVKQCRRSGAGGLCCCMTMQRAAGDSRRPIPYQRPPHPAPHSGPEPSARRASLVFVPRS